MEIPNEGDGLTLEADHRNAYYRQGFPPDTVQD